MRDKAGLSLTSERSTSHGSDIYPNMAQRYTKQVFVSADWVHTWNVRILNKHLCPFFQQAAQRTTLHALSDRYTLSFLWTINCFMLRWTLVIVVYNSESDFVPQVLVNLDVKYFAWLDLSYMCEVYYWGKKRLAFHKIYEESLILQWNRGQKTSRKGLHGTKFWTLKLVGI